MHSRFSKSTVSNISLLHNLILLLQPLEHTKPVANDVCSSLLPKCDLTVKYLYMNTWSLVSVLYSNFTVCGDF